MSEDMRGKTVIEPQPTPTCEKAQDGKHSWRRHMHMDCTDRAIDTFSCEHCQEAVSRTYYRDEQGLLLWGHGEEQEA